MNHSDEILKFANESRSLFIKYIGERDILDKLEFLKIDPKDIFVAGGVLASVTLGHEVKDIDIFFKHLADRDKVLRDINNMPLSITTIRLNVLKFPKLDASSIIDSCTFSYGWDKIVSPESQMK